MTITTAKHKELKAHRGTDHPTPHHNYKETHFLQT